MGFAAALPGDTGDVNLVVDGTVHEHLSQAIAATVPVGPSGQTTQSFGAHIRTQDVVLGNPAPALLGEAPLARADQDGLRSAAAGHTIFVPWYYPTAMDRDSIRPYHLLAWDTSTTWYVDWLDQAYGVYAPLLPVAPANPVGTLAPNVPDVSLRTAVEEIDVGGSVDVLLHGATPLTAQSTWQRDLPAMGALGAPFQGETQADVLAVPAVPSLALLPASPSSQAASPSAPLDIFSALTNPRLVTLPDNALPAAAGAGLVLAGVALYHLIRKSAILKNKVRNRIAEQVLSNPGSTITEIAAAVGVTHQTASYHLRLLQEHGLVIGVERGNKRLYFRNDGSFNNEERGLVAVLRDPESMRVLELIRQNPWIMKNEAASALGVSRNTLNWHLQKLLAAALVSEARENGHCFLFCNKTANGALLGTVAQKVEERRTMLPGELPPQAAPAPASASVAPQSVGAVGDVNRFGNAA